MAEKRQLTMAHYISYGAILCAMFAVVIGQNFIAGAEASSDITMNLVIAGAIVGAIGGGVVGSRKKNSKSTE
tara:strand:+ start:281 stop:496 length:216 start_codon:yes stop_codon:yes gene_type:complete